MLSDPSVASLITFLKEKPRASKHADRQYIDTGNNLSLIQLPRHSVVFGRRGSGKTMLLSALAKTAASGGKGVIWIDIDDYKTLTFPDILIQVLRSLFRSLERDVRKNHPWYRPASYLRARRVSKRLETEQKWLTDLLGRFEEADMKVDEQMGHKDVRGKEAKIETKGPLGPKLGETASVERSVSRTESTSGRDRKIDRISRHLHDAKELLHDATECAYGQYFLILDDFYHLPVGDQAQVLDYLQSLTKNLNVFIKFGRV